jgi:transglutaminase-like putative cysteine protease
VRIACGQESIVKSERFDALARLIAQVGDRQESRRSVLRAAIVGGLAAASGPATGVAAPASRLATRSRNQDAGIDPLIAELAFQLEYDVDQIFAYVRDEVTYDPYAGVLRGALGTLWGLSGNAADQATLLAELLNASMVKTRFVMGELSAEASQRLLSGALKDRETLLRHASKIILPNAGTSGTESGLSPDDTRLAERLTEFATRFRERVEKRSADGIETVHDALKEAGTALPTPAATIPDLERQHHVWIQCAQGTTWIDLDPSFADAIPGSAVATPGTPSERLPADFFHQVTLRMIAEQIVGGEPSRQELLSFSATSAELVGVPLTLFHPQAESLKGIGEVVTGEISGFRNFMTTLLVGENLISGKPVTFAGSDSVLDAFGDSPLAEGDTIAEWLEIDVRTPTGTHQVRREIFDRVGFAERERGPIDVAKIPPLNLADLGNEQLSYLPLAGMWTIGVITGQVPARIFDREIPDTPTTSDLVEIAHAYHYVRDVSALDPEQVPGYRTFLDAPNLTAFSMLAVSTEAENQVAAARIDLLHRSISVMPTSGETDAVHPLVAAGVLSHAVEQALVESAADDPLNLPVKAFSGVSRVFEAAREEGVRTLVLRSDIAGQPYPAVTDDARLRIDAALADGYVVIVPERSIKLGESKRIGWWLVDPATGRTLDEMDDGTGCTLCEYAFVLIQGSMCGAAMFMVGLSIAQSVAAVQAALSGGSEDEVNGAIRNAKRALAGGGIAGGVCII